MLCSKSVCDVSLSSPHSADVSVGGAAAGLRIEVPASVVTISRRYESLVLVGRCGSVKVRLSLVRAIDKYRAYAIYCGRDPSCSCCDVLSFGSPPTSLQGSFVAGQERSGLLIIVCGVTSRGVGEGACVSV